MDNICYFMCHVFLNENRDDIALVIFSKVPCRLAYRHGTANLTKLCDNISVDNNVNINLSARSIYILFDHILWAINGISLSKTATFGCELRN